MTTQAVALLPTAPPLAEVEQLSVEAATAALEHAQAEREQAEQTADQARTDLARVREAFLVSPTAERDADCERAEQALRSAERFAAARLRQLEAAERAVNDARRQAAARDVDRVREARADLWREIGENVDELLNIDAHAAQRIAIIMSLHSQDLSLYAREKSSARVAGLADPKPPPELDLLRLAFCIRLTGGRPRQQQPIGEAAARPMLAVLAQTQNEKLTASERGIIARLAVNELARCTSAETGDWLVPFYAPPPFAKHLPIWDRYRQALDLLNAILEGDQES